MANSRNKQVTVLFDSVALVAGAGNQTSSTVNLVDFPRGGGLYYKFTNGGTGPTVPAQIQINFSNDQTNWFPAGSAIVGPTGNNATAGNRVDIPPDAEYLQVVAGSNTGQNVTLRVEVVAVTIS